jgi:hypothetical protein
MAAVERERLETGVLFVGAGPATLSAAGRPTADALRTEAARAESGRAAMSRAIMISVTASKAEKPSMLTNE